MKADYITLIGFSFFGLSGFLGVFYLLRNRFREDGYLFLYLMLLLLSYEVFYKTLIHSKLIYDFLPFYVSGRFFNLLLYPVFYFFLLRLAKPDFKLRGVHWLGLLGTIVVLLIHNQAVFSLSAEEKIRNLDLFYADSRPGAFNYWANWGTLLLGTLVPIGFLGLIAYEFYHFRKKNLSVPKQTLLRILMAVIGLFFLYHQFSNWMYQWLEKMTTWSMIEWPVDIVFLSLVITLLASIALLVNSGASFFPPSRYASSALAEDHYERIITRASQLIKNEKLFTDPNFNQQQLAKLVGSNYSYLSQAINHHLGIRFNDFINEFRVEEAKRQLLLPENQHLTIAAIGSLCGFQSKSTFFRAFKKASGLTPKQYIMAQKGSN